MCERAWAWTSLCAMCYLLLKARKEERKVREEKIREKERKEGGEERRREERR